MKKRTMIILLVLAMIFALMPAASFADSGTGHDVYWNMVPDPKDADSMILRLGPSFSSVGFTEEPEEKYLFTEAEQNAAGNNGVSDEPPWLTEDVSYSGVQICGTIRPVRTYCWFSGCFSSDLDKITSLDLTGLDTSYVTDMGYMFEHMQYLGSIDFGGSFNTSKVKDMSLMFNECFFLKSLDLSGYDTSSVESMCLMFGSCLKLNSIRFGPDFRTSAVADMSNMFENCANLTELDLRGFDTSNVTSMSKMFNLCTGLTQLDISSFDISGVTDADGMFEDCMTLKTIYADCTADWGASGLVNTDLFSNCWALEGENGTEYDPFKSETDMARVDGLGGKPGYFTGKHKWGKGTVDAKATSRKTGTRTYRCTACAKTRKEIIPKDSFRIKAKPVTLKAGKLRKKAQKVKISRALRISDPKGKLRYKGVGRGAKARKALKINKKNGMIRVRKGTKKGTYRMKVTVTQAGNASYKGASKTKTIKIRVK